MLRTSSKKKALNERNNTYSHTVSQSAFNISPLYFSFLPQPSPPPLPPPLLLPERIYSIYHRCCCFFLFFSKHSGMTLPVCMQCVSIALFYSVSISLSQYHFCFVSILLLSSQNMVHGYYDIPANLQNNNNEDNITSLSSAHW